jgi:hypothetical protein
MMKAKNKYFHNGLNMSIIPSRLTLSLFSAWISFTTFGIAQNPYTGTTTVFVPYSNASTNTDLSKSPRVNISFNGSLHYSGIIMDTGSVGIVASPDIFQPAPGAKNLGHGEQYYTSSGIIEEGTWWTATQSFYDSNGTLMATSDVPVLQVTRIRCGKDPRDCQINNNPTNIAVMGIGFARESKSQPRGTPDYNAFLNIQTMLQNGTMQPLPSDYCNGWVVTPTGVYLGLTASNTTDAGWAKLVPSPQYSTPSLQEWMPASMTIDANGTSGPGNILLDTGVGTAYLIPPAGADIGTLVQCPGSTSTGCAPDGDIFGVYLPSQQLPVAFYTFTVGDTSNLMQPYGVHVENVSETFFNSSRHVLGGINFIYDNTNGYAGYIWNGLSSSSVGYVIPAVENSTTSIATSTTTVPFGKSVVFTATVVGEDPSIAPTGSVEFFIDGIRQLPVPVLNGQATLSTSKLAPLVHNVQAKYSGDANYIRSASDELTQNVSPPTCF